MCCRDEEHEEFIRCRYRNSSGPGTCSSIPTHSPIVTPPRLHMAIIAPRLRSMALVLSTPATNFQTGRKWCHQREAPGKVCGGQQILWEQWKGDREEKKQRPCHKNQCCDNYVVAHWIIGSKQQRKIKHWIQNFLGKCVNVDMDFFWSCFCPTYKYCRSG